MAYIDAYTGMDVLTLEEEEEKRKREEQRRQQLADTAVQTEERIVYGDGTQEIITKKEITPEAQAQLQAPIDPNQMAAPQPQQPQPQPQQPQQPQAAPQPQPPKLNFDRNAYNTSIAQAESGNRPDIGFHDRTKSTAFGAFGITAPAYADARRRDPSLPEDITKATAEQQTRAQNILTDNNANFLQKRGVEPTPGVLAAAHFAGANGLHKFLTQKDEQGRPFISPQAQAANGGYDKAAAIINARLNGQAMPASGAVQRPPQAFPQEGVAVATGQGVQGTPTVMGPVSPEQVQQQAQNEMQAMQQFAQQQQQQPLSPYSLATGAGQPGLTVPGMQPGQPVQQTKTAIDRYQEAQDDPMALIQLRSDTSQPAFIRQRAGNRVAEMITSENNRVAAETALPTLSQGELAKVATKRSEGNSVGDWMQYLLYKHVGLTDLANQKGEQLGIGHKWAQSTITDAAGNDIGVEIQTTASGKLLSGNRMDGTPLTAKELNNAGALLGSKLNIVGGTFVNDKTGEVGRVVSDEKSGRTYVQTDKGRRPMEGFRPQSSLGTAADQRNKLIQDMNIKLQGKTLEQQMTIQQDYNKLLVGQGFAPLQPNDTPLIAPQIAGGQPTTGQAVTPGTAPAGQAMAPAGQAMAPAGQAVAPAGQRPTASQIAAQAEAQKQEAQEVGVDLGKIKTNFGKSKDAATRLINQAEDLITDKGFSVSVGASAQPFFQYIPGSDRATWKAKHEEVVGQTFLTAIENLKGMGALSDKEGDAATAAISRLKNTDQNEESFKAAVKELQFIVKRGVDRNAEKLGREKPFGTNEPTVGATEMSPQARAAAELERRKKEKKP